MKSVVAVLALCVVMWMERSIAASLPAHDEAGFVHASADASDAVAHDSKLSSAVDAGAYFHGHSISDSIRVAVEEDAEPSGEPDDVVTIAPKLPNPACGPTLGRTKCVNKDTYYPACWDTCTYWNKNGEVPLEVNWPIINNGGPCGGDMGEVYCKTNLYYEACKATCNYWALQGLP